MTTAAVFSPPDGGVLIASPSAFFRGKVLHSLSSDARWPVQVVSGGADALVKLENGNWQVLFLDRRLPDLDADELMDIIRGRFPGIQVVLLDSDCGQRLPSAHSSGGVDREWRRTPSASMSRDYDSHPPCARPNRRQH